jgi:phosphonate transport system substrate-binding protein
MRSKRSAAALARAAFLAVIALSPGAVAQDWREAVPVLRVGLLTGGNQAYVSARVEPFRSYLAARLGIGVEIVPASDYPALIRAQMTSNLHAAFLSATAFAVASVACDQCVEPLAVPTADGEPGYYAILVTAAGSPIDGPEDLPGRRLAVSAADSLAGRLLPLSLFADAGIAAASLTLVERDSPEAAMAALLAGEADAALAWSSLAGDRAAGFSRGVLTQMVTAGALVMDQVAIAWTSPLIAYGPLAVQAMLPAELKSALAEAMVTMLEADPAAYAAVDRDYGGGFVPGTTEMFAPLFALTAAAAGP